MGIKLKLAGSKGSKHKLIDTSGKEVTLLRNQISSILRSNLAKVSKTPSPFELGDEGS